MSCIQLSATSGKNWTPIHRMMGLEDNGGGLLGKESSDCLPKSPETWLVLLICNRLGRRERCPQRPNFKLAGLQIVLFSTASLSASSSITTTTIRYFLFLPPSPFLLLLPLLRPSLPPPASPSPPLLIDAMPLPCIPYNIKYLYVLMYQNPIQVIHCW